MAFKKDSSVGCPASEYRRVHGILHDKLIQFFKQHFWKYKGKFYFFFASERSIQSAGRGGWVRSFICELCFLFSLCGLGGRGEGLFFFFFLSPVAASINLT